MAKRTALEEVASLARAGASILRNAKTFQEFGQKAKPAKRATSDDDKVKRLRAALQPFVDMLDIPGEPPWVQIERKWLLEAKKALEETR